MDYFAIKFQLLAPSLSWHVTLLPRNLPSLLLRFFLLPGDEVASVATQPSSFYLVLSITESSFYSINHPVSNDLDLSISIIMSLNDKVKVLWKTKCAWRDHAHWPKRKEIKLLNQDDTLLPLKPGDAVKIKFGSKWYNAEVAEHWRPKSKRGMHLYGYIFWVYSSEVLFLKSCSFKP